MRLTIISLAAVVGWALGDGSAGGTPQGALLVLPQPYSPSLGQQPQEPLDKVSERVMERLQQEQGSQRGNYHVYLSDGRLQRVQYTAAPLRTKNGQEQQSSNNRASELGSNSYSRVSYQGSSQSTAYARSPSAGYSAGGRSSTSQEPNPVIAHFGRLQQERLQQQLDQLKVEQEQLRRREEQLEQQLQGQKEFARNYVATIQFSDVPPIPAPIYAQGSSPVTRILRYAPQYFH